MKHAVIERFMADNEWPATCGIRILISRYGTVSEEALPGPTLRRLLPILCYTQLRPYFTLLRLISYAARCTGPHSLLQSYYSYNSFIFFRFYAAPHHPLPASSASRHTFCAPLRFIAKNPWHPFCSGTLMNVWLSKHLSLSRHDAVLSRSFIKQKVLSRNFSSLFLFSIFSPLSWL